MPITTFKKFTLGMCKICAQIPCDENLERCPMAIAMYLIVSRDDDLCDYISQYLCEVKE